MKESDKSKVNKDTFVWKATFFLSGIYCMFHWNCILNMEPYFKDYIHYKLFDILTFTFSAFSILSFMTSRMITKKLKTSIILYYLIYCSSIIFALIYLVLRISNLPLFEFIFALITISMLSFLIAAFQGVIAGLCLVGGPSSILYYNLGYPCAGVFNDVLGILFEYFFPTSNMKNQLRNLNNQLVLYILLSIVYTFFLILFINSFMKKYKYFISKIDECKQSNINMLSNNLISIEDDPNEIDGLMINSRSEGSLKIPNSRKNNLLIEPIFSNWEIFKKIIDIWMGILISFVITFSIISYMYPHMTRKYDKSSHNVLILVFFLSNFCDFFGILLSECWVIKNLYLLHFINFLQVPCYIYFVIIIMVDMDSFLTSWAFRIPMLVFVGLLNGFLSKNFYSFANRRFAYPKNVEMAGYLINFAAILGIAAGTFMSVLWIL